MKFYDRVFIVNACNRFDAVTNEKVNLNLAEIYWKNELNNIGWNFLKKLLADGDITGKHK